MVEDVDESNRIHFPTYCTEGLGWGSRSMIVDHGYK